MYYRRKGERIMFQEDEFFTYLEKRFQDIAELMTNGLMTILILLGGFLLFLLKANSPLFFLAILGIPFLLRHPIRRWTFNYLSKLFLELVAIRQSELVD